MTDRQITHAPGCWGWGPKHYECAVREIERLRKMHQGAYQRGLQAGSKGLREMYDAVQAVKRQDAWGNAQLTEALMEAEERAERAEAEIERLRAEVAAWRELSDHVRVGACAAIWPDRYTDARTRDVAAALKRAARLEEEVERLRADRDSWEQQASDRVADWHAEHLRAERLAEALRSFAEDARNAFYATGCASCDALASRLANYAAALRDHDQEDRNG